MDITKAELKRLYEVELLSTKKIGELKGCCAEIVRRKLHEFGIKANKVGPRRLFNPPKAELEKLYQKHSMRQLADQYGVGETVVWKRLQEHGIKLHDYEDGGHRAKPGRIFSKEHRVNMSKARIGKRSGSEHHNWKGGIHYLNLRLRQSAEYRWWKIGALERAGLKCENCGVRQGKTCKCCGEKIKLHVHHVKSFSKYPKLRFDPKNSEVLCPKCHYSRHN